MHLIPIPAFSDNYLWLLHDGQRALVVDPGAAEPVLRTLKQHGLQLESILVTHHHADHTGGVAELRQATGAQVYGPATELVPQPCVALQEGASVQTLGLSFQVFNVPGHTAGHIAFYLPPGQAAVVQDKPTSEGLEVTNKSLLFCGDTLFSGGCGRLFEGTPAQMLASLDKLADLPGDTLVCAAHEYTLSNLRFALAIEPDNAELAAYYALCLSKRSEGQPTLPSSIHQERLINPFLRTRQTSVVAAAQRFDASAHGDIAVFAAMRHWKNEFK
ncbi:hydroxyacylglutathione hydrolase [Polaromonas sp.]|nr:hydroxyacylglutathione hydrolase [Polaromonas sp.]